VADFQDSIFYALVNESGANLSDAVTIDNNGGVCKWGLNSKANPDLLTAYGAHLENMTLDDAKAEYQKRYWLPIMDQLTSQRVATKLLDQMVNQGQADAINHLQLAVGLAHPTGFFGPVTLQAANGMQESALLMSLVAQSIFHYTQVEEQHPEDKAYDKDWMARANKLPT
jgi:lysozyme family protein